MLLPLFTDWDEIHRWIDQDVSTLVMPATDAFSFASKEDYAGAVVNSGGQALELPKDLLAYLMSGKCARPTNPFATPADG